VAWYGKLVGEKTLNSPKHPVDIATELNAPVLGLYGGQDTGISLDSVETMRHALRAANAKAEIVVYPDAGTRLTPIIVRAITKNQPKTAGRECWRGLASTAVKSVKKARWRLCLTGPTHHQA
jgi:hypothetical protein